MSIKKDKTSNPLRFVSIVFILLLLLGVFTFVREFFKGHTLTEIVEIRKVGILSLGVVILFLICYWKKNILAWWIAVFTYPIVFASNLIIKNNFDEMDYLASVFVFILASAYLYTKYTDYKKYLNKPKGLQDENLILDSNSGLSQQENPLLYAFYMSVFLVISTLADLFISDDFVQQKYGALISYFHQIALLAIGFSFIVCYMKLNIFAWWIAWLSILIPWVSCLMIQPFRFILIIFPIIFNVVCSWYLVVKYSSYFDYIKTEKDKITG